MLSRREWTAREAAHRARALALTAEHRERRAGGLRHAVEDFLFEYYSLRPGTLTRWHPGAGVVLAGAAGTERAAWRWYRSTPEDGVTLDAAAYLAERGPAVGFIRTLLAATASRPAQTGCFGLHEWAMVYREPDGAHRHPLPLRLGEAGTDAVVEAHAIRCSHFDAYRFFTAAAEDRNTIRPTRAGRIEMEQPGCLHANMDLLKWSLKLGPAVPGELLLDCFELALEIRRLDMRASPYDLAALGAPPVRIETAAGKAAYVRAQRSFAARAAVLRDRLLAACAALPDPAPPTTAPLGAVVAEGGETRG